jgi:hypothetical protein
LIPRFPRQLDVDLHPFGVSVPSAEQVSEAGVDAGIGVISVHCGEIRHERGTDPVRRTVVAEVGEALEDHPPDGRGGFADETVSQGRCRDLDVHQPVEELDPIVGNLRPAEQSPGRIRRTGAGRG